MNWKSIIADIQAAGWTQARIGQDMGGRPQSWVADIASGRYKDLKWADGEKLLKLHRKALRVLNKEPANA